MARLILPFLLWLAVASPAFALDESDLLPVDQAFQLQADVPAPGQVGLHWTIAKGYYLYRHRISATASGAEAGTLDLPEGEHHQDEFFGQVQTYRQRLDASLPLRPGAQGPVTLTVRYQGCADAGLCYPPQQRTLTVDVPAGPVAPGDGALQLPGHAAGAGGGLLPAAASSGVDAAPLPPERAFQLEAAALDGNRLLLRFTPAPGYYLYRDQTRLALEGAPGLSLGAPQWPPGRAHQDAHFGQVTVYFDQVEVPVPVLRERTAATRATLVATFQGCQDNGICYPPMTRRLALDIPAGDGVAAAAATPAGTVQATGAVAGGTPPPAAGAAPALSDAAADNAARTAPPASGDAVVAGHGAGTVLLALLGALLGGLVLNLMPCVLPVLSLKVLALAEHGRSRARSSALWYTAGVLASFLAVGGAVLALRASGQALGWGFQLQQPWLVALLAYVMFAVGLGLSGVFALGHRLAGLGHEAAHRGGPGGDFLTGVLAVVVASPCTAPFMGAALAFAFAAPVPLALAAFALLGLGLALPFLLIGLVPALARHLPRPGAWMDTLKQLLAFPMYLTAVWLLWVLGQQRGVDAVALALGGMVVLALGLWAWHRVRGRPWLRVAALVVVAAALLPLLRVPAKPAATATAPAAQSLAWSPQALDAARAEGKVVFVDVTADWCVTCKANEKAVLDREDFRDALQASHGVLMRADYTDVSPQITAFLQAHGAVGVPLYVVYPPGTAPSTGEVLPVLLTPERARAALERAAR